MFTHNRQPSSTAFAIAARDPGAEEQPGSFTEESTVLRTLFDDPDGRGPRKWRDIFNPACCEEVDLESILAGVPKL
ncbi:hypothetical protein [Sphingomicrobium astaxanthinifaciens]|uniref:hypothetical protein n=1 Tax=Sphingomicrobium astaxanthinifaciens TaxID=1227949 RepID=UPI001FCCA11C|nr:hypothetical protein [Sphingomicrobium astaxanthinifaciens]MCJ7421806.1 hypothetical protein [Sphingomicrobium astaxanthinifaciens]